MTAGLKAHVIVLTHNGQEILQRNFASVVRSCQADPGYRLTVVDNASTDGTAAWLASHHPEVEVVRQKNDYLFSLNDVVAASPCRVVILLNDDLATAPGFIAPLLEHFTDPSIFAVSCKAYDAEGKRVIAARVEGAFSHGMLEPVHFVEQLLEPDSRGPQPTFYTHGGCAAFDRDKFVALGGFDRIYHPIYMEDVDICYRAQKRGWRCLYDPRSVVYDEPSATMSKQASQMRIKQLTFRNTILFTWKNVSDWRIFLSSFRTVFLHLRRLLLGKDLWRLRPILEALARLPQALLKRRRDARGVPDRQICRRVYGDNVWP